MNKKVMTADERDAQLRKIVGELAGKYGVNNVTRRMVAKAAKCSEPLVSAYLGTLDQLKVHAKREARKLGLTPPKGKEEAAIGAKLRAHKPGDARDTRKRSVKEVKTIKEQATKARRVTVKRPSKLAIAGPVKSAKKSRASPAPATVPSAGVVDDTAIRKLVDGTNGMVLAHLQEDAKRNGKPPITKPQRPGPTERKPTAPPERKSAARAPKLPPLLPPEQTATVD